MITNTPLSFDVSMHNAFWFLFNRTNFLRVLKLRYDGVSFCAAECKLLVLVFSKNFKILLWIDVNVTLNGYKSKKLKAAYLSQQVKVLRSFALSTTQAW